MRLRRRAPLPAVAHFHLLIPLDARRAQSAERLWTLLLRGLRGQPTVARIRRRWCSRFEVRSKVGVLLMVWSVPVLRLFAVAAAVLALAGCATMTVPRNAPPDSAIAQHATLPNMQGVRAWADEVPTDAAAEIRRRVPRLANLGRYSQRLGGRPVVEIGRAHV